MNKQSRLEQVSNRRFERNILFILLGIIILVVVAFFYAIPLLINFSLFILNSKGNNDSGISTNSPLYIPPPILNPLPDATNNSSITVSGSAAMPKQKVELFLNDVRKQDVTSGDDKNFVFKNVTLNQGDNDIKAKAVNPDNKESDYSSDFHILFNNKPPDLQLNSPQDNQTYSGSNQIKVEGKSISGARITVNGYWAIVDNSGNFSYLLNLQKGENKIKVIAADDAGNQSTKEITVTLNQ